jgi:hypothetical protein
MAYPTLALHLLISAPGDVPIEDMAITRKTISQWNLNLGRQVGLTVLPMSWTEHAVAEFGERPQAILNPVPVCSPPRPATIRTRRRNCHTDRPVNTGTLCRSIIELCGLSWGYAAWWYSLITPVTTGLRRMNLRSFASAGVLAGWHSASGDRCRRAWWGRWGRSRVALTSVDEPSGRSLPG